MASTEFENLISKFANSIAPNESSVDWVERKNWWIEKVKTLLEDDIRGWLGKLISSNVVKYSTDNVSLTEETLGTYTIKCGTICINSLKMTFKPVASVIVGGFGRIDVDGPNGNVMLILSAPDQNIPKEKLRDSAVWYITNLKQHRDFRPLTTETFEQLVVDLFGISK